MGTQAISLEIVFPVDPIFFQKIHREGLHSLSVTSYKQVCGSLTPTLKAVPISW